MTKPADLRPVGQVSRPALAPMEVYYLRVLKHWYRFRRRPPSVGDLVDLCQRSGRPGDAGYDALCTPDWPSRRAVRRGLLGLEAKGYAKRNDEGRFEVIR